MEEERSAMIENINDIIEELTTSGSRELDDEWMCKLKNLCKKSQDYLKVTYDILMIQLQKEHSEIRYSTFQIINKLFLRSHLFRTLVIFNLQKIFTLTIETDPVHHQLPFPIKIAKTLKLFAIKTFYQWYKRFGKYYHKLELGYEFLKDVKKIQFDSISQMTEEQRKKERLKNEKDERIRQSKLEQVTIQLNDSYKDIVMNIKQLENCFQLLLPKIEGETQSLEKDLTPGSSPHINNEIKEFFEGIKDTGNISDVGVETGIKRNYTVSIDIATTHRIKESSENIDIIQRMSELFKELTQQSASVKKWLNVLVKCNSTDQGKIKKILDLKNTIESLSEKYNELKIVKCYDQDVSGSDDDDEFIDVPEQLLTTKKQTDFTKPVTQTSDSYKQSPKSSTSKEPSVLLSRKEKLMKIAPIISYGVDLHYWEQDKVEAPASYKFDSLHRFWKPAEHEESFVPPQVEAALKIRKINFTGTFEPVTRKCGAPLPNGNLCGRMDREKCPFHGKIVDRDGFGRPLDYREAEKERKRKHQQERQERESIQKEIDTAIGTRVSNKKRKMKETPKDKSRRRYARLTNIKTEFQTVKSSKLEAKVFSSRALNKVYDSMNSVARRVHEERFGSQFNY